ncbi:MAG TPA: alpha/beta fold hydrolase [Allosphingosinicella sp.]|jgi:pimeloyl-ACP methyl ester carboxylesterase
MIASLPSSSADKPKGWMNESDQQTLVVNDHRIYYRLKIKFPTQGKVSIFCREYTFKQMLVWDGMNGSPGFHVSCMKHRRNNRKLVIWLHGGPWVNARSSLDAEQLAFVGAGYDLFIPLYPGSTDRPIKFEGSVMVPDVVDALTELKAAYGWGRKHYERVDVAGESFGAFLAASLAPELGQNNSLFLFNPSLGGKSRLEEYYARRPDDALMRGVPKEAARAEVKRITDAYFGRLRDYAPLRVLESTKGLKLKLIYGGRDDLMKQDEIQSLIRLAVPGCGVHYRPDNGHESGNSPEQYEAFRKLIRCGNVPPHRGPPVSLTTAASGASLRRPQANRFSTLRRKDAKNP